MFRQRELRQKKRDSKRTCVYNENAIYDNGIADVERYVDDKETFREVMEIISNALSETERKIILGFYFDGKTETQLADELGITAESCRKKKSRGLKKVKELFNKKYD